ncbi:MAG: lipoyl(octanoyl) transferase LipB [Hyphomicrobium sp.]
MTMIAKRALLSKSDTGSPVAWTVSSTPVAYPDAVALMEARAAAIARGEAGELVWLLEHPPLYTAGPGARREDLLEPDRFEVHETRRGGQLTYHGPGQRVAYVLLDVGCRGRDVRAFVSALESWVIATLAGFGVEGETRAGRVGVWVSRPELGREDKIAAIGVRLTRWVSLHGISINVAPDLGHYAGIVPCGIAEHGVTSLADLGIPANMEAVDKALRTDFERIFGPTVDQPCPLGRR